jgi:hypothetical protein
MNTRTVGLAGALILGAAACQDMDVTNPNNPNRESVLQSPADVQALVSGTFVQWFNRVEGSNVTIPMSTIADEFSTAFFDFGGLELSQEPRAQLNPRSPNSNHSAVWQDYYRVIAGVNTAFRAIEEGNLTVREGGADVTMRLRAFGKFMQGLAHGQVALTFDKGYVSSEGLDFETLTFEEAADQVRPYTEVLDTAIAQLEQAIEIAQANTFTLPATQAQWIPGLTISNQQLARLAHTYIARFIAYTPRTPAERAAVNWQEVLTHLDQGITGDFAPEGTPDIMESLYKNRASRQRTTTPSDFMRVDYMVVGPADTTEGFRSWYNTPAAQRQPFRLQTPDRRIEGLATWNRATGAWTGATPPTTCANVPSPSASSRPTASCGLYMGFHDEVAFFNPGRGTYLRSFYFYHRYGRGTSWESGPITIINQAELDLLRAEALIRLGRAADAVPLINKTRVPNGGLAPVTIDGVPGAAPNCVPRKISGACGNLWDALRYEKRIETLGLNGGIPFYDHRGWGILLEGSILQFPMPVVDIELLFGSDAVYTFGGDLPGSAPARNLDACPAGVSVPGC